MNSHEKQEPSNAWQNSVLAVDRWQIHLYIFESFSTKDYQHELKIEEETSLIAARTHDQKLQSQRLAFFPHKQNHCDRKMIFHLCVDHYKPGQAPRQHV